MFVVRDPEVYSSGRPTTRAEVSAVVSVTERKTNLSRMKDLWEEQCYAEEVADHGAQAEAAKARAEEAEERARRERDWAARHPNEWVEWIRIYPLLMQTFDFGSSEWFDFPQFLTEVGLRPSLGHTIERRDDTLPYKS